MKLIKLTQGKFAQVDDADFEWLSQWKWSYHNAGYACRSVSLGPDPKRKGKYLSRTMLMHALINSTPDGYKTDHRDGNKLNNQRYNLRTGTHSQNIANHVKNSNNTSGYKGVIWDKRGRKWVAQIKVRYKNIYLGSSPQPIEAAKMYNVGATKYFGEFAKLNKITELVN